MEDISSSTKSNTTDDGSFTWATGDAISVYSDAGFKTFDLKSGEGTKEAKFEGENGTYTISGYAIYPAGTHRFENEKLYINLPAEYGNSNAKYVPNTNAPMVASVEGDGNPFKFNHAGGVLCITLANVPEGASKVVFSTDKEITGEFEVAAAGSDAPSISAKTASSSNNSVSVTFQPLESIQASMKFYIPLPVGTYQGFTIELQDGEGNVISKKTSTKENSIERRSLAVLPTIEILRILTFEDADYKAGANYLGETSWSSLIDTSEYGGPLLYGEGMSGSGYEWYDENNTYLKSAIIEGGPFWNGGHVISNYASTDVKSTNTYEHQLTVYGEAGKGGNNGSANFCVHNGYVDASSYKTVLPSIEFGDGVARVIDHMYINSTNYLYDVYLNGNGFSVAATADSWFKVIATGYDADGNETGTLEYKLADGLTCIQKWTKWELKTLGKVVKVTFNLAGTDSGDYGLNTPAYFAYDDVAVQF